MTERVRSSAHSSWSPFFYWDVPYCSGDRRVSPPAYRWLLNVAITLTFLLILLGSYVRQSDAGLGCPDWPGCYGFLTPEGARDAIHQAVIDQGGEHGPVSMGKAWREMVHRYVANFLGLLVLAIAVYAWRKRHVLEQSPAMATMLFLLVVLQGLFGWWTVSMRLQPLVVTLHLLGGMLLLSCLAVLRLQQTPPVRYSDPDLVAKLWPLARMALICLVLQLFLGGWTGATHAGLACPDFPKCQGQWWPKMAFSQGFQLFQEGVWGPSLTQPAQAAVHMAHRLWAFVTLVAIVCSVGLALRCPSVRKLGAGLLIVLCLQVGLGVLNAMYKLPSGLAVAHTAGAALLLLGLVWMAVRARQAALQ